MMGFQSSPSPKTGRYSTAQNRLVVFARFQSSPSPKTGRYHLQRFFVSIGYVPILTQSENWALSEVIAIASQVTSHTCSNPHPVRKLGAIALLGTAYRDAIEFQSSPSPKTGRYSLRLTRSYLAKREFQSSPSPKTGRYVRIVY